MAKMSYREALTETLHQEMANDENVIVMGEDVVGGTGSPGGPEAIGGVFGVTGGLFGKYGAERVIDMPISEAGIAGTAAGAALAGKRPVAETNLGGSVSAHGCARDVKYSGSSSLRLLRYRGVYPTSEMLPMEM